MALYFFDLHEGDHFLRDEHGTVCTSNEHAILCARKTLTSVIAAAEKILAWDHTSINVRCEDGSHIARIGMTVEVETQNRIDGGGG